MDANTLAPGAPHRLTPQDDLAAALASAPEGACLILTAGRHVLYRPVVREGALTLRAEGDARLELDARLAFEGDGAWAIRGIAIAVVGPVAGLSARSGRLELADCTITGREGARTALRLQGDAGCRLNDVTVAGFSAAGVVASESATLDATDCRWRDNAGAGVRFQDAAGGELRNNLLERNGDAGVRIEDRAAPELEGNIAFENGGPGLHYMEAAGGGAYGNLLEGNRRQGILLEGQAAPTLEENTARRNLGGIRYAAAAGGRCFKNTCDGNLGHDISLAPGASPMLVGNHAVVEREQLGAVRRAI